MSKSANETSFLKRAQQWIASADDVDVEKIDGAIAAVVRNQTKAKHSGNVAVERDLTETVTFLQAELFARVVVSLELKNGELQEAELAENEGAAELIYNEISTLTDILARIQVGADTKHHAQAGTATAFNHEAPQYNFDTSSLTNYDNNNFIEMSKEEKQQALCKIKALPEILKLSELIDAGKKKNSQMLNSL